VKIIVSRVAVIGKRKANPNAFLNLYFPQKVKIFKSFNHSQSESAAGH